MPRVAAPRGRAMARLLRALLIVGLVAGLSAAVTATAAPPDRPNIVIILGDDLGFSDMGQFGG